MHLAPRPHRALRALALALALATLAGCASDQDPAVGGGGDEGTSSTSDASQPADEPAPEDEVRTLAVVVAGGRVEGGPRTEDVALGETVRIEVTSDTADEVHVHGYDLTAPVEPGAPAVVEVEATIPGVFEVELEGSHLLLLELRVQP